MLSVDQVDRMVDLEEAKVNLAVYTSEEVFQQELRNIWYRTWVYVGHESELAQPGDYKTSYIGLVPIILSRDDDGQVHALVNRCIHRGTTVCQSELGNSQFFRCEYHGWVYSNRGDLIGTTLRGGYDPRELERFEAGLQKVPRVDTYRGMIFASLAEYGEDLTEHLGNSAYFIDCWADQSPQGELELSGGVWTHRYQGNWKIQYEGSDEGYHPAHLHRVALQAKARLAENSGSENALADGFGGYAGTNVAADLLRGHSILAAGGGLLARSAEDVRRPTGFPDAYVDMISDRVGGDAARLSDSLGDWRMVIFPNVAIHRNNLRTIRPIKHDLTEVKQWSVHAVAAPEEINASKIQDEQSFYGPAGFGAPDDFECFERIQEGYGTASWDGAYPWVWFNRQLFRQWIGPRGERCNEYSGEAEVFAIYHEWKRLMSSLGA